MTYAPAKFVVATFNDLGGYAKIYKKIYYLTFDLDLEFKVRKVVAQYHLHNLNYWYVSTKFKITTSNSLGEETV